MQEFGKPRVIGLGGGTGSGKTTLSRYLAERGWVVIDLDLVARGLTGKGQAIWKIFVLKLGRTCLDWSGEIDRLKVGKLIFRSQRLLLTINQGVHSVLRQRVRQILRRYTQVHRIVLDGAVLFEAGLLPLLDILVYVDARPDIRIARLIDQGCPEREAIVRVESQLFLPSLKRRALIVVSNNGDMVSLEDTIQGLEETLRG